MSFKAIAFDLDGTLLDSRKHIRPSSLSSITAARAKGVEVILATGRHHMMTYPYHQQLNLSSPAICCNGTYLHDFEREAPISAHPINRQNAEHFLKLTKKHGVATRILTADAMNYMTIDRTMLFYAEWRETLPEPLRPVIRQHDDYTGILQSHIPIYSFVVIHPETETMKALERDILTETGLICEWFAQDGFDIANRGNSKGTRLLEWAKANEIDALEIIAFGDNHNDSSMLKVAGLSVAMGNAAAPIKAIADVVAPDDNNGDAIETILRHYIL